MSERVLIIDGLNAFLRNFCVVPMMDANGEPIGGIIGTMRSIKSVMREVQPDLVVVAWDGKGGSSKRRGVYEEYKAGRKPRLNREYGELEDVDESRRNMRFQYAKLREYLDHLGVVQSDVDGCEADDVIAYLCHGPFVGADKIVVSTDKDFLQLVDSKTAVYSPTRKTYYREGNFVAEVGLLPKNYIYMKAFVGDGSDNVRGIKGIGPKTFLKLFPFLSERESDLIEIMKYAEESQAKNPRYEVILAGRDVIRENVALMQLSVPIISSQSIASIRYTTDPGRATFNMSQLKLMFIRDGIQLVDGDFFHVFSEYRARFERINGDRDR